ncbi:molybdenum cofactor biosynthesis protein C [Sulfolobus islandicus Y.G.57.14]|jgi:cyclic pyranopterin phosphate synthase|uniref:Probable cyclic pyranopterin monophosphate synthase n=4 Tax=Saccharolobus islandicus TaxID=43080 RepID=C3MQ12_SACI2|nr:cyclic pyranopterin monophosphate synthase MoaC [Sulfolobus islandicus]ACP35475.1 molybdenum cofactor biosynthesis protein C [Sulfolobus islandicus L.S.2.15]ACP45633.1 molybdenum cofactor biosynthesis protein C [Sulfolobus islandicus Y.G.57.14]ACP48565.1 molybdenum cofactor biosynthesis protein C [Sulfolobus islandicus Y.N.15.51]ADB87162.1 molybdenum cofactor biosynthesis protein C [Sulfolobus islandicus L.D.8.5]PVU78679.1 cyclic pyranopterin monophosphate synthase MoaC [Sulfolobus islandic
MSSEAKMVDISPKETILRVAEAEGFIKLKNDTIRRIMENEVEKGNVIAVAKTAGIMAAKKTSELLPLCHLIPLENVDIDIKIENNGIRVRSKVKAHYKTGVEMEALVATSISLLTIWDMVKKYEKDENGKYPYTIIKDIKVIDKIKEKD